MFFFIRCSHEPAAIPCLKQKNPPYTVTQSSIKLHFNIIPSPIVAFVKWPLHLRFSHIILHAFFNFLMAVTFIKDLIRDFILLVTFGEQHKS